MASINWASVYSLFFVVAILSVVLYWDNFRKRKKKQDEIMSKTVRYFTVLDGEDLVKAYSETGQLLITLPFDFYYKTFGARTHSSAIFGIIFSYIGMSRNDCKKFYINYKDVNNVETIKTLIRR